MQKPNRTMLVAMPSGQFVYGNSNCRAHNSTATSTIPYHTIPYRTVMPLKPQLADGGQDNGILRDIAHGSAVVGKANNTFFID